jgi:hypothetical protein
MYSHNPQPDVNDPDNDYTLLETQQQEAGGPAQSSVEKNPAHEDTIFHLGLERFDDPRESRDIPPTANQKDDARRAQGTPPPSTSCNKTNNTAASPERPPSPPSFEVEVMSDDDEGTLSIFLNSLKEFTLSAADPVSHSKPPTQVITEVHSSNSTQSFRFNLNAGDTNAPFRFFILGEKRVTLPSPPPSPQDKTKTTTPVSPVSASPESPKSPLRTFSLTNNTQPPERERENKPEEQPLGMRGQNPFSRKF